MPDELSISDVKRAPMQALANATFEREVTVNGPGTRRVAGRLYRLDTPWFEAPHELVVCFLAPGEGGELLVAYTPDPGEIDGDEVDVYHPCQHSILALLASQSEPDEGDSVALGRIGVSLDGSECVAEARFARGMHGGDEARERLLAQAVSFWRENTTPSPSDILRALAAALGIEPEPAIEA